MVQPRTAQSRLANFREVWRGNKVWTAVRQGDTNRSLPNIRFGETEIRLLINVSETNVQRAGLGGTLSGGPSAGIRDLNGQLTATNTGVAARFADSELRGLEVLPQLLQLLHSVMTTQWRTRMEKAGHP
jgi:hypothetical protein